MTKRDADSLRLLEEYTQAHGASGHEDAVRSIFAREMRGRALSTDGLGGVLAAPSALRGGPRIVLTAHMDEVGFLVQDITADGFLRLTPLGGWPDGVLCAQRLRVFARATQREFTGIVAATPPHHGGGQSTSPDKVFVDLGARSREAVAKLGIRLGDPVVPEGPFTQLAEPDLWAAKAFDNRAGMAALTLAARELTGTTTADVLAVATTQEEVGCRGAVVAARLAKPDVVIVLEGPPADDTPGLYRGEAQGALGAGVQIRAYDPTAIMNPRLMDLALAVASEAGIPHQLAVRRTGGTDARAFQAHELGVPVIVLGIPARYIHTHNSVLDLRDFHACVDLTVALTRRLDAKQVTALTRYL